MMDPSEKKSNEKFPIAKKRKKGEKRYVSKAERKARSARMKQYWKKKKNERAQQLHEASKDAPDLVNTTVVRKSQAKHGHRKDIRKDNLNIVIDYKPFPQQFKLRQMLERGKRFVAMVTGIRYGKTHAGAMECIASIYTRRTKSGIGWIVAPDYNMAAIAQRMFEKLARPLILKKNITKKEYLLRPAKEGDPPYLVQVKSAEHPDRLRGAEPDWVWWDEAAMCDEEVFDILMGRVITTKGKIWATTTPRGLTHWFYDQWVKRAIDGHPEFGLVQAKTTDNPMITDVELDVLREKYTKEFAAQELLGSFVDLSGLVYKDFKYTEHTFDLNEDEKLKEKLRSAEIIAGVDWGYRDPLAFLWIAKFGGDYYILGEHYLSNEIPRTSFEVIKRDHRTPRVVKIYAGVDRPENRRECREILDKPVLPGRAERDDKIPGIQYVASLFQNDRLFISKSCRNLVDELGKYCWKDRNDLNTKDRTIDAYDHCLDALRYALYSDRFAGPAKSSYRVGDKQFITEGEKHTIKTLDMVRKRTGKRKSIYRRRRENANIRLRLR